MELAHAVTLEDATRRIQERLAELAGLIPGLLVGVAILLVTLLAARAVIRWRGPYERLSSNVFVQDLARQAVSLAVLLLGALVALDVMGATSLVAALLGTAGVVGLALGFAFKDLIENYVAGVLLSIRQPFAPDDLVVVDGEEGRVVRLSTRATILMTRDGNHLRLPNAKVFKATILNYTRNPRRRFTVAVGVGTEADLLEARRLGIEVMRDLEGILAEPAPVAIVDQLGDSSVLVHYHGWVDQRLHDFLHVRGEAIRRIKTTLEFAGIELPEPTFRLRTVDVGHAPPPSAKADDGEADLQAVDELGSALEEEKERGEPDLLRQDAALE